MTRGGCLSLSSGTGKLPINERKINMATKKTKAVTKAKPIKQDAPLARKSVIMELRESMTIEERAREHARIMVSPELSAFCVLDSVDSKGALCETWKSLDVPSLIEELRDQAAAVNRGELNHVEAMLMNQATALQSLFARLAARGMGCEQAPAFEANMRIALRSQSQCRATLETLAAIKNPPVVFAKQANINQGNGNQQVNNGTPAPATHAGKNINQQNELLEVQHGSETVDTRTTGATIGKNPAMATVG